MPKVREQNGVQCFISARIKSAHLKDIIHFKLQRSDKLALNLLHNTCVTLSHVTGKITGRRYK